MKQIKPFSRILLVVLVLIVVVLSITVGMRVMGTSSAGNSAAPVSYQPAVYTGTVGWDFSFPVSFVTDTYAGIFALLDIEARLEDDTVIATQVIDLGMLPLDNGDVITMTNWTWGGSYPEGAYQAVRLRCVIPQEIYLVFSPTTALDDSGLVYDGYYDGVFFIGEFYGRLTDGTGPSDDRGFWPYGLLPTADETPEPTDTPAPTPTDTPEPTPTSTPWYDTCPGAPNCATPEPTPTDRPTLTPQPTYEIPPTPTCRLTPTCPATTPYPTEPPYSTGTPYPTYTPWPTQPSL